MQLIVTGLDGGTVESPAPDPVLEDEAELVWESGTDLDGVDLTLSGDAVEPTADVGSARDPSPASTTTSAPVRASPVGVGFGRRRSFVPP